MKLVAVTLRDLPGLARDLALDRISPGATIVVAPNGAGKTSLARGVRDLLWKRRDAPGAGHALWSLGDERLESRHGPGRELAFVPRAPDLPDERFARLFFLDLDAFRAKDRGKIDEELRKVLTAGFDIAGVRDELRKRWTGLHMWTRANRDAEKAARDAGEIERHLRTLDGTRGTIAEHAARIAAIDEERRAAASVARALAALDAAANRDRAEAALAELPRGIEHVRAADADWLEERLERRRALASVDASETLRAIDVELAALPRVEGLAALVQRIDPFALSREVDRLAGLVADGERALADIGLAGAEDLRPPTQEEIAELEQRIRAADAAVREREHAQTRVRDAEHRVASIGESEAGDLEEARAALRRWLDAESAARAPRGARPVYAVLAAVSLVLVGVFARSDDPLLVLVPIAVAAAAGYAAMAKRRSGTPDARATEERRFAQSGVRAPSTWRAGEVAGRLAEIEAARRGALERDRLVRDADDARREAGHAASAATRAQDAVTDWLAAHGLPTRGGLDALSLAGRLANAERARATLRERRDALTRARRESEAAQSEVAAALRRVGVPQPDGAFETAHVLARLADLDRRREDRERERANLADAEARRKRELAALEEELARFAERRALDRARIEEELAARIEELPRRDAMEALRQNALAHLAEARVTEAELAQWRAVGREAYEGRLAKRDELDAERDALVRECERLKAGLARAEGEAALEEARAKALRAEEVRDELFDEALAAFATDFLVADVELEYHARPHTDLLVRASALFEEFTGHAFRLAPPAPGDDRARERGFRVIVCATGVAREPEDLSSATFAQLELALRISLLEHVEAGREPLPLFVDEVLTHSDPVRFEAVSRALARLVAAGRQIVFLTSDPADAERFGAAARAIGVDVDRRGLEGAPPASFDPAWLAHDAPPPPPAPADRSAAEYAVALGVGAPDPFAPADALHPFHLFADDLGAVHALARARFGSVGALRSFVRRGGAVPPAVGAALEERALAADALFAAYREGRSPPVPDRVVVEAIGSSSKVGEVLDLCRRVERDGRALLDALARKEVKNVTRGVFSALERHLDAAGLLSNGEALSGARLVERALDLLHGADLATRARLHDFVAALAHRLGAGLETDHARRQHS